MTCNFQCVDVNKIWESCNCGNYIVAKTSQINLNYVIQHLKMSHPDYKFQNRSLGIL